MSNSNEIDKQTLNEFLQCYVSTAFLGLAEPWRYKVKSYKTHRQRTTGYMAAPLFL